MHAWKEEAYLTICLADFLSLNEKRSTKCLNHTQTCARVTMLIIWHLINYFGTLQLFSNHVRDTLVLASSETLANFFRSTYSKKDVITIFITTIFRLVIITQM